MQDIAHAIYVEGPANGKICPTGKIWCGETADEREQYLDLGIAPRPKNVCEVVRHVRYLDAAARRLYPCSLLPHRINAARYSVPVTHWNDLPIRSDEMNAIASSLSLGGFHKCHGCSSTAAAFTPSTLKAGDDFVWDY